LIAIFLCRDVYLLSIWQVFLTTEQF
jgi:hypothetical protein